MKLATIRHEGRLKPALIIGDEALDLSACVHPPASIRDLLESGAEGLDWARAQADTSSARLSPSVFRYAAPVPDPRKFLSLGGNYPSHLAETRAIGIVREGVQTWFNKQVTCVHGPYDPVWKPPFSDQFDYEGELGVIIGARCRSVAARDWRKVVAGCVVINDLSVRDWQMRAPTHTLGKSFDTHGPLGPWLVTLDELEDPHALVLSTFVNGEKRQSASTGDMIYRIGEMIEELTTCFTLEPGDILSTRSPGGVGGLMKPPAYLKIGDVVRVEIEGIGAIQNTVVAQPTPTPPYPHDDLLSV